MRGNAGPSPREAQFSQASPGPGLAEVSAAWGLFGVVALAIFATYTRVAPQELYHVSHDGWRGGASRLLVFLNYPTALMAIAVLALVTDRLVAAGRRRAVWPALLASGLCLAILFPGVVDQSDLDANPLNALPALGVLLVLLMTVWSVRMPGTGAPSKGRRDWARIALVGSLALLALPWIFAELGVFIGDIPGLDSVFRSKQLYEGHRAVHLGEHHGFDGFLLVVAALLLSRQLRRMRETWLRPALAIYLSLMIPYGLGNMANDAWLEQVVKRGWASWEIPGMIRPDLSWPWALTLVAGAAIYLLFWRRDRLD